LAEGANAAVVIKKLAPFGRLFDHGLTRAKLFISLNSLA
jgi:hypothetical protein